MKSSSSFIRTRHFAPLFGTQFFGAFNDNFFKTMFFVMISFGSLAQQSFLPPAQLLNLGTLLFVLPYFLFSAQAGQLATRYNKARLAQLVKLIEIGIMFLAAWGFAIQSTAILMFCLFMMGTHSTLFGPIKYAILPEYLHDKELVMGNGLIESGTFIAILLGQIFGTFIAGNNIYWLLITSLLLIAIIGFIFSLFMPNTTPQNPNLPIDLHIWNSTRQLLKETFAQKELTAAILGISWFWFIGAIYTTQLPTFVKQHLGGNDHVFNLMLALFSIGIALGSILCAKYSRKQLHLRFTVYGSLGLSITGIILAYLNLTKHTTSITVTLIPFLTQPLSYITILMITLIGICGGFFSVPLYTWLQTASKDVFRAQAVAANNIINGLFMVASAIFSSIISAIFDNTALLYFIAALSNIPVIYLLIRYTPQIWHYHD